MSGKSDPATLKSTVTRSAGKVASARRPSVLRVAPVSNSTTTSFSSSVMSFMLDPAAVAARSFRRARRRGGWLLLLLGRVAFVGSFVLWTLSAILQSYRYGSSGAGDFGVGPHGRRELSVNEEGDIVWSAMLAGAALAGGATVPDGEDRSSFQQADTNASVVVEAATVSASALASSSTAPNNSKEVTHVKHGLQLALPMLPNTTEEHQSSSRPQLILHVGLPKTGTTYLQCSLCSQFHITEPILLRDNWVYLGTCPYEVSSHTTKQIVGVFVPFVH
jgi:hypothetical protein